MTKYKEYFGKMLAANKEAFDKFQRLHDEYALNPDEHQEEFNKEGAKILEIIHEWENRLCLQSEKGGFSKFTAGLAEKFMNEVRKTYPQIDSVGIKVIKSPPLFSIKKISL